MRDILNNILPNGYNKVKDLERVGETNFLYGGLNILYGMDGSGKSWQVVSSLGDIDLKEIENIVYLDTDGSNGSLFVEHCYKHGLHYINNDTIHSHHDGLDLINKVMFMIVSIVKNGNKKYENFKPVFVIDSLTSIGEGRKINNAEDISPLLYKINNIAEKHNICIILIDHATELYSNGEYKGFKLEGNSSAKRRTTVTINRYEPLETSDPKLGGIIVCERARGNIDGLSIGNIQKVFNKTKQLALEWIKQRQPEWLKKDISKTEFSRATKHKKDSWVRDYFEDLFDKVVKDKTTYLRLEVEGEKK